MFLQSPGSPSSPREAIVTAAVNVGKTAAAAVSVKPGKKKPSMEQLRRRYQENVDGKALIIFPMAFFLFNLGYWGHYLADLNLNFLWEWTSSSSS